LKPGAVGELVGQKEVAPWADVPGLSQEAYDTAEVLGGVTWYRYTLQVEHEGLDLTGLTAAFIIESPGSKAELDSVVNTIKKTRDLMFFKIKIGDGEDCLTAPACWVPSHHADPVMHPPLDFTLGGRPLRVYPDEQVKVEVYCLDEEWCCLLELLLWEEEKKAK
jgi:hypothetical protein